MSGHSGQSPVPVDSNGITPFQQMLAFCSGALLTSLFVGSVTVISPLELIRTKMQAQRHSYRELSEVIRSAVRNEGWRSLWRGWGPTLLRDVPFSGFLPRVIKVAPACAIMISCYEFGKAFFRKHNQERLLTSNT